MEHPEIALLRGRMVSVGDWTGTVRGVFPRAVNIVRDDGLVVSLVERRVNMTVFSVMTSGAGDPGLVDGGTVRAASGFLETGGRRIRITGAPAFDGIVAEPCRGGEEIEAMKSARSCFRGRVEAGGLSGTSYEDSPPRLFGPDGRLPPDLSRLVGLGPGLTPSGDDFITGALMAGAWLPGSPAVETAGIESRLSTTTGAGRTLLTAAVCGMFPAYLLAFLDAARRARGPGDTASAVKTAANHGATSGRDALAGFFRFLDTAFQQGI